MILSFSTQLNGKPTYFVERIWEGLLRNIYETDIEYTSFLNEHKKQFGKYWDWFPDEHERLTNPKVTTFREDKNDRRKPGTNIDFFINCRQKNMFRFAPVLPVVSTQKVLIEWRPSTYKKIEPVVWIEKRIVYDQAYNFGTDTMIQIAKNDGFDTIEDFFAYFKEDFTGKIIHWTELRY